MGLIVAAGLFFFVGLSLESVTSWIAIRGARKHYPKLWAHSGEPTLMGNSDLTNAWPLVSYYRDRKYLEHVQYEERHHSPIVDKNALAFAEKLRGPLLYTYYAAWVGIIVSILLVLTHGILD
jgi:hypothetical protein